MRFFRCIVIEMPRDQQEKRQYDSDLITLCGDTELFEPPSEIKVSVYNELQ